MLSLPEIAISACRDIISARDSCLVDICNECRTGGPREGICHHPDDRGCGAGTKISGSDLVSSSRNLKILAPAPTSKCFRLQNHLVH